jgi:Zn-dependent protease with chaperone function
VAITAVYFDGEFARDRAVTLTVTASDLEFSGEDVPTQMWSLSGLHPIDPPSLGQPFRITHDSRPGARLVIRDEAFITNLVDRNSHLKGGYTLSHLRQVAGWTVGGIAVAIVLGYVLVSFLPGRVASLLPEEWRNRVGEQIVKSLVGSSRKCSTAGGDAAKSAMVTVLAEGNPDLPAISFEIYDIGLVNAFAAPGGKIIFTRGILEKADNADEIAGVLAHEIGHVAHRHPEAQLVRLTGVQVLISLVTGSSGGDFTSNIAGLAALLRYSREAEREADTYARNTMDKANINPLGLRTFFEKIMNLGGKDMTVESKPSALEQIGNVFSTHPGTEERIKEIVPLPADRIPVQVLTAEQWKALKEVCS